MTNINPLTRLDYPDPDVIRVGDTYYMISTTMYFMPGGEILRSYDLVNWEHAAFVYDRLDSTPAQCLENGTNIYGKGMWAACIRYHKGMFYVAFVCNDTHKTYLYTSEKIEGPWKKSNIDGFYHDCSILFDDDDRVYIVYGNREIHLTELNSELTGPKVGGIDKVIVKDSDKTGLGYEGSHFYKINGKYYIFFIHSLEDRWFRTEACFTSDSIDGEFIGGDIFVNDMNYCNMGVAQGGIVDTPDGKWYGIFFQDRGAVGRIPVLVPMEWKDDYPKMSDNLEEILNPKTENLKPGYEYSPLYGSDLFDSCDGPSFGFMSFWQFNHEPDLSLTKLDTKGSASSIGGTWSVTTDRIVDNVTCAKNTITQRLPFPKAHVEVTLDATNINDGDYAGLAVLQGAYGFVGITKDNGRYYMVMKERVCQEGMMSNKYAESDEIRVSIDSPIQTLSFDADFLNMKDEVTFNLGPAHKMYFKLDHFTGNRAGLFIYSTKSPGGKATFSKFVIR